MTPWLRQTLLPGARAALAGAALLLALGAVEYLLMLRLLPGWEYDAFYLLKNGRLHQAALAIGGVLAAGAVLHFFLFGPKDIRPRGRRDEITWWSRLERVLHWIFAAAVLLLVVTGIVMYVQRTGLPTSTTRLMRRWHYPWLFTALGAVVFLRWYREALPRWYDLAWLRHFGGYLGFKGHLKAGKFNAGQKLWFWIYVSGGMLMGLTGYRLEHYYSRMEPEYYPYLTVHLGAAIVFMAAMIMHIYLAVIAVRGALGGMIRGKIGRRGALREHSEGSPLHRGSR